MPEPKDTTKTANFKGFTNTQCDDWILPPHPQCDVSHTKYQPKNFRCPQCDAVPPYFIIDYPAEDAHDECEALHVNDELRCESCGWVGLGTDMARKMKKKENAVQCPCCKGKGWQYG